MWKRTQVDTGAQPNQNSDSNRIVRSIYDRFSLLYRNDDLTLLNTRVLRYCLEMFSLDLDEINIRRNFVRKFLYLQVSKLFARPEFRKLARKTTVEPV